MSLSLSLWSLLINSITLSLSLSLSLSMIGWPKEGISALALFIVCFSLFFFVFLNCAIVLILSVGVVLVSVFTVLV